MKKTALILSIFLIFSQYSAKANGGFCSVLETVCDQNKIDLDAFSSFFQKMGVNIQKVTNLEMYTRIFKWFSTPYRYGGKGSNGIDCSNYVHKLLIDCYDNYATSRELANMTEYVDKEDLKEGDLIFFNVNGGGISHVGVYLQDGKFTHSCSSKGVTISSLNEPYWDKRYCRAGRINH